MIRNVIAGLIYALLHLLRWTVVPPLAAPRWRVSVPSLPRARVRP